MKYFLMPAIACMLSISLHAQVFVQDSVTLGSGNTNQSFYSLAQGEQVNTDNSNWDLQFWLNAFSASVRTNGGAGVKLFDLASNDTTQWNSVDTTNMTELYNSDTSWDNGSFNQFATGHPNYGWGQYQSLGTLIGIKIFVIKIHDGSYKKIWIEKLNNGIVYNIKVANLDNSVESTFTLSKSDYPNKSFVYYSIVNNAVLDIEPMASDWDIVFRSYLGEVAPFTYYPVVGALTNIDVQTIEARGVDLAEADPANYSYSNEISIIGWDWKIFNNTTFTYDVPDSLSYFVKDKDEDVYHIAFDDYGGSATGKIRFSLTKLNSVGISEIQDRNVASLSCYPNPADHVVNFIFDVKNESEYNLSVIDMSGKELISNPILAKKGLNNYRIPVEEFALGSYIISVNDELGNQSYVRFIKK
ncbi:MAG: T9SS type A sorting domain-containing protein [Chitinophagales bacterium]|nr:T9SS type A sorting domain-containing protein [Chitinophagales bacterium]